MTTTRAERPASCDRCWAAIDTLDRFCGHCGAPRPMHPTLLEPSEDPRTTPIAIPPQMRPSTGGPARHAAPPPVAPVSAPGPPAPARPEPHARPATDQPPAWAGWTASAGIALIGLVSLVSSFSSYYGHNGDMPGYLAIAMLDTLLLVGFAVLAGFAVHAVLARAQVGAGLAGAVVGAAATSAVLSGPEQGLGVFAVLGALAATAGVVVLATTGHDHDPLTAARHVVLATGIGCAVAGLRAGLEAGYFSTGSYGVGCVLWLGTGAALLAARSMFWGQRTGRLLVAGSAAADLLAVTTGNQGEAFGCLLLGLHLAALTLLYAPAPARAAYGESPLPGLVQARDTIRRRVSSDGLVRGTAAGSANGSGGSSWSGILSELPVWVYAAVGLGAVLLVAGLVTTTSHTAAADACIVAGTRSLGLVRDTPECDAAFDGEHTGKMLMAVGVLIAIAPFRLASWWEKQKGPSANQHGQS